MQEANTKPANSMRLTNQERQAIQQAVATADADAEVYLFGSRVDDTKMGGDIDLLVLSRKIDLMAKLDVLARLHQSIGEQKIDLVIFPDASQPFARMAIDSGARL